jgi:hypothetical protein
LLQGGPLLPDFISGDKKVVLGSVRVGDLEPTETSGLAGNWQIAFLEEAEPRRPRYSAVPKAQSQVSAGTRPTTAAARTNNTA